ncbi:MAG: hypothetical protein H0U75_08755 [Legionella sp.]|nr:hypothetical protein [Legionella sp.]
MNPELGNFPENEELNPLFSSTEPVLDDSSNEKTKPNLPCSLSDLNDIHKELVSSIEHYDYASVVDLIESGIDLNIVILKNNEEITPLGIAVTNIDLQMTQLLLENGACPNLTATQNRSVVELLMISIGSIEITSGQSKKHPMTVFGIKTPINIKTVQQGITSEQIENAHKIIDLLLCYGLKKVFKWTEEFEQAIYNLTQAAQNEYRTLVKRQAFPQIIDDSLKLMKPGIKKKLISCTLKGAIALAKIKAPPPPHSGKRDTYIMSLSRLKPKILEAATGIENEKIQYNKQIFLCTQFPTVILSLILHYSNSFIEAIANQRQKEKRIFNFWVDVNYDEQQVKRDSVRVAQYHEYNAFIEPIKELVGNNAYKIILNYLVDISNENGDLLDSEAPLKIYV